MNRLKRRHQEGSSQARRAARREEFVDAAIRAIRRYGPRVSMHEMAAEAGVTKPILYRHFGAKGGLYHAIAERYTADLLGQITSALVRDLPSRELIETTLDAYLGFLEQETEIHRFLMERALQERPESAQFLIGFREQVAIELEKVLRDRVAPVGGTEGAGPWAHAVVGMAELAGEWWMDHHEMTREQLVNYLATLLWSGFSGIEQGTGTLWATPEAPRRGRAVARPPSHRTSQTTGGKR
jgi:AcrR family transcriptional regulator